MDAFKYLHEFRNLIRVKIFVELISNFVQMTPTTVSASVPKSHDNSVTNRTTYYSISRTSSTSTKLSDSTTISLLIAFQIQYGYW